MGKSTYAELAYLLLISGNSGIQKRMAEGRVHWQEFFIPHTPFLYKTRYNRHTFTLFLLSKRFVSVLYEIPFYVRGGKRSNKE